MDRGILATGVLGAALFFGVVAVAISGENSVSPASVGLEKTVSALPQTVSVPPGQYTPLDLTQTFKLAYQAATRSPEVNNAAVVYFHEIPKGYDVARLRDSIGKGLMSGSIKVVELGSDKIAVVPEVRSPLAALKPNADVSTLRVVTFAASAPFKDSTGNPQKWVTFGAKPSGGVNF